MKKSYLIILVLLTLFCFSPGVAAATAWDGSADTAWYTADPGSRTFEIDTPQELAGLAQIVNGAADGITADSFEGDTVTLTANLDLGGMKLLEAWSGPSWIPIGSGSDKVFAGVFKGNNKHITNFYINATTDYQGLFGYTAATGKITNLFIDSGYIKTTGSNVGSFVASNKGNIINCKNAVTVDGNGSIGGITGGNSGGYLVRVTNNGAVISSGSNVGGITGGNSGGGTILQCTNTGNITSTASRVGGIIGNNTGSLKGAYNTGAVSSTATGTTTNIGGIVGSNSTSIAQAYCAATVTGNGNRVGGVTGSGGTNTNCFYLKTATVNATIFSVGGAAAATGDATGTAAKDGAALGSADTVTVLAGAFVTDSTNLNNGYPVFSWQVSGVYPDDEVEGLDIDAKPTDMTGSSFKVKMNHALLYTTLVAADFRVTANVAGEEFSFAPASITQTNTATETTVTLTFPSVHAEKTVQYKVQYKSGMIFSGDSFTTPATDNWIDYFATSFDGGTGTVSDPYQIRTAEQLAYFGKTSDKYEESFFVLTADLDISAKLWTPKNFNGCFDGQGHSISGLKVNYGGGWYAGLFGQLNNAPSSSTYKYISYVANLRLLNPSVTSTNSVGYTGAIAGEALDTNLINCTVEGGSVTGKTVGGLVGSYTPTSYVGTSSISACSSTATVQGTSSCGGLIGNLTQGNGNYGKLLLSDCFSGGSVSGSNTGGLVGSAKLIQGLTIDYCFTTATVSGTGDNVGGLMGQGDLSGQGGVYMGADGITIRNSVALNPSVSTSSTKDTALKGRIIANGDAMIAANKGTFSNHYGYELTLVNGVYATEDETSNGKNITSETSYSENFWENTLGFDFDSAWSWSEGTNHPQLKGSVISNPYAIAFSLQPHDATAYRTKAATFGVAASGGLMNYTYQWQYSTDNGAAWKNIDTATTATLSIGYQDGYASGTLFRCAVIDSSNNKGISDSAKLTVVTSKYMPDDALKGILSYYKNKGTLNTAGEAFALSAVKSDLSGYKLNLPAHYTYFGHNGFTDVNGYSVNDSFYFPWIMMDLYAQGEDPQNYVVTSNGNHLEYNIIDLYLNTVQNDTTGGFESKVYTPGTIVTNEYAIPSIITGLEMYFDGNDWGNESDGAKLGRDGAIDYALSLLKDDVSGGKTFGILRTGTITGDSGTLTLSSQRAQCEFVLLMVRLSDDPVYGDEAKAAMSDVLKAMEAFYDDGKLTGTETGGYYVSALIGAASVTDNYFKKTAYLNLADEILKDIVAGSQSIDGGYGVAIGTSTVSADAHATAAMMMALGDYNNESASLADFTYTIKDVDAVSNDLAVLSLPATVTGDLALTDTGAYGSAITWVTSDKNAITAAGKVNRTSSDVAVTLTATVKKGDVSQTKAFNITVKANADADTDDIDAALNAVTIPEETVGDITVPASSVKDVTFDWVTSDSGVLATNGTVTRPTQGSSDVTVTLTLTAAKGSVTKTREYPVLVYAADDGYMEAYHTGRGYYLVHRDLNGYWQIFAAYALLGDYIQDPANGYNATFAKPDGSWYGSQYGATVLALCAMGENPYDYNGVNYVQLLKQNYGGPFAATTFSQLGMIAAGADSSYYTASPSAGISMTKPENMTSGVDIAGWASEILALYAGQTDVDTAAASYLQYLKTMGVDTTGNFTKQNCISTSCVVSGLAALYAAGYENADPTGGNWTNTTSGKNVLDVLYDDYIVGKQFPGYLTQGYMALGDAVNAKNGGTSAWIACRVTKDKLDVQIAKANAILANEDLYTGDSVAAVETALATANNISAARFNAKVADFGQEYYDLYDAVRNVKTLGGVEQDQKTADEVMAQINTLPAADGITLTDKTAVTAARTAYDTLTADQKGLVHADVLAKLTAAENAVKALEADEATVNSVAEKINALPATIKLSDESAVTAARTAYDALNAAQQGKISADTLAKLTAAEKAIADLKGQNNSIDKMTDISAAAWYHDDVAYVLAQGIMKGTSSTTFSPLSDMTRAQFITILGRYAGITDSSAANPSATKFSDVTGIDYYASHVAWAIEKGITNGTSSKNFLPDAKISREDMAVMMARYAKAMNITLPDGSSQTPFADDSQIADYAKAAVYQMKAAAIIEGVGSNRFAPQSSATRAQAAAIMHRFMVYADSVKEPETDTVTMSVEKFTLGRGYIVEPILVEIEAGDSVADVFDTVLDEMDMEYSFSDTSSGFYMRSIKDNDTSPVNIPQYIVDKAGSNLNRDRAQSGWLGEFDYTFESGWNYWVNNAPPAISAGKYLVKDGDVIRWQFTVYGIGLDLGRDFGGQTAFLNAANKDALTTAVALINTNNDTAAKNSAAYANAITVLNNMESTQAQVDSALAALH